MNAPHAVVWNGSRATDPYLCVDVRSSTPSQADPLTPERRAEIVGYAQAHGVPEASRRYGMSGYTVGWLIRKAMKG